MFEFITKRSLWVNVVVGLLLGLLLFGLFLFSLGWLTGHGNSATVPNLAGKSFEEAKLLLEKAGFDYKIQDSIYVDTLPPLHIIKQLPDADEVVKANRTILLIVRSVEPPLVEMPNLVGYSFRNAEAILGTMGLHVGDTVFRPDFARNAVLEQLYKGSPIATGTRIRKGSLISLVIGDGIGDLPVAVPVLVGMDYTSAKLILDSSRLGFGAIVLDPGLRDTLSGFIYRQSPARFDEDGFPVKIRSGQLIDIWLGVDRPAIDTLNN
ncbi:MAG: PASTA domain-containing protein [Sphingomonadales bacterium]